jgi:hypothetical protein
MSEVDQYLRIFRWRGLTEQVLLAGDPDPHETAVALIQLAALARHPSHLRELIPQPLLQVLREQVEENGALCCDMTEANARALFLSDLYDFLRLYKLFQSISADLV